MVLTKIEMCRLTSATTTAPAQRLEASVINVCLNQSTTF